MSSRGSHVSGSSPDPSAMLSAVSRGESRGGVFGRSGSGGGFGADGNDNALSQHTARDEARGYTGYTTGKQSEALQWGTRDEAAASVRFEAAKEAARNGIDANMSAAFAGFGGAVESTPSKPVH